VTVSVSATRSVCRSVDVTTSTSGVSDVSVIVVRLICWSVDVTKSRAVEWAVSVTVTVADLLV